VAGRLDSSPFHRGGGGGGAALPGHVSVSSTAACHTLVGHRVGWCVLLGGGGALGIIELAEC